MDKLEFESMTLCPLDGRYGKIKDQLADYFSEYALVKYRVFVEIQWLKFQLDHLHTETLDKVDPNKVDDILAISKDFNFDSFKRIKEIESVTRHDVKAVEYFIDEKHYPLSTDDEYPGTGHRISRHNLRADSNLL